MELFELELDEISLVPAGDDPLAKIAIVKRHVEKEKEIPKMTDEMKAKLKTYMDKGMTEEEAKKAYDEDMEKSLGDMKAENERLRKALIEDGFVIKADAIEKKAPEETIEVEGELVAKSAIPAPVLKALEAAAVAKQDKLVTEKAQTTLPHFDLAVAKSFMGMDLSDEMLAALKAADALFAGMTEEVGKTDTDGDMANPMTKFEAARDKLVAEKKITKEQAIAELTKSKEGRTLVNEAFYGKGE